MMQKFIRLLKVRTLRGKFLIFNIPIMLIAVCLAFIVFAAFDYRTVLEEVENHVDYLIDTNKENLAHAMYTKHAEWQAAILQAISNDPNIVALVVLDKNEHIIYQFKAPQQDNAFYINHRENQLFYNNRFMGTLKLNSSTKHNVKILTQRLLIDLYLSLFAVLLVILSALIINRYTIDIPLRRLLRAIQLTKQTSVGHTVQWQSTDEIGSLVKAFNEMQLNIQEQTTSLVRATEQAIAANRAKSEFIANISHELRTPMHTIIGLTNMCIKKHDVWETDELVQTLNDIKSSSERLLSFLNELLDISKLEAGKMQFDFKHENIFDLITAIIKEVTPLAEAKSLHITIQSSDYEDLYAFFDYNKIGTVLRNLLSNAINFSKYYGNITIRVTSATDKVKVSIIDEGIGIPSEEMQSIFEKFVQSSKTKTGAGGTGLGLSISKEIILAHHGMIYAENNVDTGSIFTFILPKTKE